MLIIGYLLLGRFVAVIDNACVYCYLFQILETLSIGRFHFDIFPHFSTFCLLNSCTLICLQALCEQREMFAVIAQGDRGSLRKYRFPETAQKGKVHFYLHVQ